MQRTGFSLEEILKGLVVCIKKRFVYIFRQKGYVTIPTGHSTDQRGGKFFPEDIDPSLCDYIVYAFATMTGNRLSPYEWNDDSEEWMVGM